MAMQCSIEVQINEVHMKYICAAAISVLSFSALADAAVRAGFLIPATSRSASSPRTET